MRIHPIPSAPTAAGNGNTPLWGSLACDPHKANPPPPEAAITPAPFIRWLLFRSTFTVRAEHQHIQRHSALSLQRTIKSVLMLPACHLLPQWGIHGTHTNIIFKRGTVWIKKKRKRRRRHCEKINACSGEHSRSSVDGRCLKHWQLSRDSDCLVGFLLHFRTEVAAFVVGSDITMHYTYSQTLCTAPLLLQHSVRNRLPTNSCLRCMFNWIC